MNKLEPLIKLNEHEHIYVQLVNIPEQILWTVCEQYSWTMFTNKICESCASTKF